MNSTRSAKQGDCGCSGKPLVGEQRAPAGSGQPASLPKLEDLIPIAVVIAAGCEPCAERMVRRALSQGSPRRHIRKVLGIVAHMQELDCLVEKVGEGVTARMAPALAMARRVLQSM